MNRDQTIADLVLHGFRAYAGSHQWVACWSEEQQQGRLCKFFKDGLDGPGWDVRPIISDIALINKTEVPWAVITTEQLEVMVAPTVPPKYRHNTDALIAAAVQNKGWDLS